ncbi:insulinase family protein [Sellimonas intestinalis]|uniref:insulinase family protein n=1 Tax=Sellimonas intestinalis TaxID=1653434 RepID=UPI0015EC3B97|nr:insulinase family protein [Sellimonas intestinalis]MBA2212561.1 insulinase family protein [Sellimonas intestinalis]
METKRLQAYELMQEQELKGIQSKGYLLRHKKSGARIVLIENEDENKVFSVGFRTPPQDSTGLPHILEHSVLCGSREFPAKDPFVELVKGSLNTFLNAMTYPDKTVYPVASCNDQDFQNLMHVYMDAVFYPNIYENDKTFRQEGWSYELEDEDGELKYNGVVYNEMKGAFSSPDGVLDRMILNSLFPDTSYSNESGGDPDEIPSLTYEDFLDFHRKYYHPSNSYLYLYGDMDMEAKLTWLDEHYLSRFDYAWIDSEIKMQKPFEHPVEWKRYYSISNTETEEMNTYLSYNKVVGTSLDEKLYLAFSILDYALLSAPGAPLKKALTDAGIGHDILGSYENGICQPIFSVIAKNAEESQKDAFIQVIESTLTRLVKEGIDPDALAAGIHYHEFRYREADFGSYPKGLMYGLQMLDSWLYDEKRPFLHLDALDTFAFLKEQIGTSYYEDLIQKYLLDNTHASIVMICPKKGMAAEADRKIQKRLQDYKRSLSREEVEKLVKDTKELRAYQEEPTPPEILEKIPVLKVSDISEEAAPVYNEERKAGDVTCICHPIETNGIGYLTMIFDLRTLTEEEIPYAGLLQAVLGIIDTEHYEYGKLFHEINRRTGGSETSLEMYTDVTKVKEKEFRPTFEIKAKALYAELPFALSMMEEILMRSVLSDEKRLKEILEMLKSRLQMKFLSAGHSSAVLRAMSYHSPAARFKDMTNGIEYYETVSRIADHFDEEKGRLVSILTELCKKIFRKERMIVSYTGAKESFDAVLAGIAAFSGRLWKEKVKEGGFLLTCTKKNEGFQTASKVQYVAMAGNFIDAGMEYHGALQILKVIMGYEYLWQNIRVKGGAYGCMSSFNRLGEGYFVSYRDPHLKNTLDIYQGVTDYLRNFAVSDRDMTKFIIGTISNMDQPMTPAVKGDRSMNLYMNHVTKEMMEQERREVLHATQQDIRNLAGIVEQVLREDQVCVIGNEEKIEQDREVFTEIKALF